MPTGWPGAPTWCTRPTSCCRRRAGPPGVVTVHDLATCACRRRFEPPPRATGSWSRAACAGPQLVLTPSRGDRRRGRRRSTGSTRDRVLRDPARRRPGLVRRAGALRRAPARPARALPAVRRHRRAAQGPARPARRLPAAADAEPTGPDVPPLVLVGPVRLGTGPRPRRASRPTEYAQLGYLDEDQLRPVVAAATALCFPSLYEGFGLPPLEALAAGTPVVASDIPAVREVVGALAGTAPYAWCRRATRRRSPRRSRRVLAAAATGSAPRAWPRRARSPGDAPPS